MTDPIADMLNQIKNAQAVNKQTIEIPYSDLKYEVAKTLENNKFILSVEKKGRKTKRSLELALKYTEGKGAISGVKRISKPGQKIYNGYRDISKVMDGYGMAIISTSKGIKTDREVRKEKLGGEILAKIW